jgi:hypothetical protein
MHRDGGGVLTEAFGTLEMSLPEMPNFCCLPGRDGELPSEWGR